MFFLLKGIRKLSKMVTKMLKHRISNSVKKRENFV